MILFDRNLKVIVYTNAHSYTFVDLHMDFTAEMDRNKEPNNASVTLYNLSKATREAFTTDFRLIEVYAGYGKDDPPLIYVGSITDIVNKKQGPNWITEIKALDGGKEYYDNYYNKAFSKGTPVENILQDVINAMGLPFENSALIIDVLLSGASYSGKVKDVLTKVCKDHDLEWSIQRGTIEVINKGEHPLSALVSMVLLGPDTGMIDSPSTKEDGSIVVKSLINPEIRPNRLIKIMPVNPATFVGFRMVQNKGGKAFDTVSQGIFIVDKVKYSGSNYGANYELEAECVSK